MAETTTVHSSDITPAHALLFEQVVTGCAGNLTPEYMADKIQPNEILLFKRYLIDQLYKHKGISFDAFYVKITGVLDEYILDQIKEHLHSQIKNAVANLTIRFRRSPTTGEIAEYTGTGELLVAAFIKNHGKSKAAARQKGRNEVMQAAITDRIAEKALNGDMKAARLFLELTGAIQTKTTPVPVYATQNNYIQINGQCLEQSQLSKIPADKMKVIEGILSEYCRPSAGIPQLLEIKPPVNNDK